MANSAVKEVGKKGSRTLHCTALTLCMVLRRERSPRLSLFAFLYNTGSRVIYAHIHNLFTCMNYHNDWLVKLARRCRCSPHTWIFKTFPLSHSLRLYPTRDALLEYNHIIPMFSIPRRASCQFNGLPLLTGHFRC